MQKQRSLSHNASDTASALNIGLSPTVLFIDFKDVLIAEYRLTTIPSLSLLPFPKGTLTIVPILISLTKSSGIK